MTRQFAPKRPRVHNDLQASIARLIATGEFPAGRNLPPEAELTQRFGVSRTALREAIKGLEAKFMLRSKPRVGTVVLPQEEWSLLDQQVLGWVADHLDISGFVDDVLEARQAIEPAAAVLACRRATLSDLAGIERALLAMAGAGNDPIAFTDADLAFHEALLHASHNRVFTQFIHSVGAGLNMMLLASNKSVEDYSRTVASHRRLLDALIARNETAATAASLALIDGARADLEAARARAAGGA
ncbi:MAG: FadR/GntR family transcriptional regulator [Paracoccus sp. (in: a-proteobacteria)]|nr:FadR/GntR family transcriptional regulator [Paracoccus sp. (in: a-proteobacteria)]